jgi:alkaline phosphatase D
MRVQNDYAGNHGLGDARWPPLRAAALAGLLRAYAAARIGPGIQQLSGSAALPAPGLGRLARLHLLDARQYRDRQACRPPGSRSAGSVHPGACSGWQPQRSFLGWQQEAWLQQGLAQDGREHAARWSVLAQQTLLAAPLPSGQLPADSWDGYPAARARLLNALAQQPPRNTVVLGGDIHQNYVCNLMAPPEAGKAGLILASEFCGTSISSRAGTTQDRLDALRRSNPCAAGAQRGARLRPVRHHARTLDDPAARPARPTGRGKRRYTLARFVVEDGRAGPSPTKYRHRRRIRAPPQGLRKQMTGKPASRAAPPRPTSPATRR